MSRQRVSQLIVTHASDIRRALGWTRSQLELVRGCACVEVRASDVRGIVRVSGWILRGGRQEEFLGRNLQEATARLKELAGRPVEEAPTHQPNLWGL